MADVGGPSWQASSESGTLDALVVAIDGATLKSAWHVLIGGSGTDHVEDVAVDGDRNAYAVGTYDSPTLAPAGLLQFGSGLNGYALSFGDDGGTRWGRTYGQSASNGITRALSATADRPNGVVIGGDVRGGLAFAGAGTVNAPAREAFMVALESALGSPTALIGVDSTISSARGVGVDALGDRVVTGEMVPHQGQPAVGTTFLSASPNGTSGFVFKMVGARVAWAMGYVNDDATYPRRVAIGAEREITIFGRWSGTTSFGDHVPRAAGPLGSTFVLRLAP
jgi:hypothetical protein